MTDIDSGVAVLPTTRPSVFTSPSMTSGYLMNRPAVGGDTGTATTPAPIFNNFDDVALISVIADPGY